MSKVLFDLMRVRIYISGTVRDNGAVGGFSALMVSETEGFQHRRTLSGFGTNTSVTRMQLKAIESALISIKAKQDEKLSKNPNTEITKPIVEFYTTNAQVSAGLNRNVYQWSKNDWLTQKGEYLQHCDLYQNIFYLLENHVMSHRVNLQKLDDTSEELVNMVKHSLFMADNTAKHSMNKKVSISEESFVGSLPQKIPQKA